ncbi:hypothetical protein, partial [Pseudomonas aeruginosa]
VNPTIEAIREDAIKSQITVFDYNSNTVEEFNFEEIQPCSNFKNNNNISWINIDGIRKKDIEAICNQFGVHYLIIEDILSIGQRPK